MGLLDRWMGRRGNLDEWCIAYIDVNPYRLQHVSKQLSESGVDVKVFEDGIYVRNDQYTAAMDVINSK